MQITKQKISSNIAVVCLILLLIFLTDLKFNQWRNEVKIEKEKQNLLLQADVLQKKNNELNQSLQILSSTGFKERVARQQLDLKKKDEQVYSFSDAPKTLEQNQELLKPASNAQKWWDYFFSID